MLSFFSARLEDEIPTANCISYQNFVSEYSGIVPTLYIADNNYIYVRYCFGDYINLLSNHPISDQELMQLANFIIAFYDYAKGIVRKYYKGDSKDITYLRAFTQGQGIANLQKIDFAAYNYNYDEVHSHVLAKYSLSNLLLRILEHNLANHGAYNRQYQPIDFKKCELAYQKVNFNDTILNSSSSWSEGMEMKRCNQCRVYTVSLWGKFHLCLDCYTKRVCRECGTAIAENSLGKPLCVLHQ
jgi:hypothetical protein